MHVRIVSVRFGLMLEAFCRGAGLYMKELSEQLQALTKMKHASDTLQNIKKSKNDDFLKTLHEKQFTSAMEHLTSPLDPSLHCRSLKYVYVIHNYDVVYVHVYNMLCGGVLVQVN